jgi:hypothetical protein
MIGMRNTYSFIFHELRWKKIIRGKISSKAISIVVRDANIYKTLHAKGYLVKIFCAEDIQPAIWLNDGRRCGTRRG